MVSSPSSTATVTDVPDAIVTSPARYSQVGFIVSAERVPSRVSLTRTVPLCSA